MKCCLGGEKEDRLSLATARSQKFKTSSRKKGKSNNDKVGK